VTAIAIDDIDRELIRALQADGRASYSQLSRLVGLSDAACRQRVMRLRDEKVIDIVAVTDPAKLGLDYSALLGITVSDDVRQIAAKIESFEDAVYVVISTGRYDLLVELVSRDIEGFLDVSNAIRTIPGVSGMEVMSYLEITKQTYDWGVG